MVGVQVQPVEHDHLAPRQLAPAVSLMESQRQVDWVLPHSSGVSREVNLPRAPALREP